MRMRVDEARREREPRRIDLLPRRADIPADRDYSVTLHRDIRDGACRTGAVDHQRAANGKVDHASASSRSAFMASTQRISASSPRWSSVSRTTGGGSSWASLNRASTFRIVAVNPITRSRSAA